MCSHKDIFKHNSSKFCNYNNNHYLQIEQQGADSEGNQTKRQNSIARNSYTASFNRQRDYWATKSYLLKYIGKPGAGQHHPGYGEGQIEVQEVILKHARGEIISIADWRKFWKEPDTDLKLYAVTLQFLASNSDEQGKEKDQSSAFWNNLRKRYGQDDGSNSGGNNQNFQLRYNK
ncbi:MAG: hypothetical protein EZS28_045452 [Streblomastix strix]|uniref:Uncharacterized protein n=1 Tax=Streblomastix strix TaxID=222440 RepID=A0A5J4TMC4_9EUKA|nr:MAG: hypothetical protein EZS28_045452 [Streblomastix strix]